MQKPKISIITVCYNAEKTIRPTIDSVLSQTYDHIEYVIVDGSSKDSTLDIVKAYGTKIHKVISEKDKGIYDAMNKGAALATGDVVFFLNADDRFCDDAVVSDVAQAFMADNSRMLIYGDVRPSDVPAHIAPYLTKNFQFKRIEDFIYKTICHQAIFAKRSLFTDVGNFNCQYRYSADYEWLIRVYKHNPAGFYYIKREIADFYYMGTSFQENVGTRKENTQIRSKHIFGLPFILNWLRYDVMRGIKKKILNEPM